MADTIGSVVRELKLYSLPRKEGTHSIIIKSGVSGSGEFGIAPLSGIWVYVQRELGRRDVNPWKAHWNAGWNWIISVS